MVSRTNLDEGPIMGKTITTDTQTGNLVVAIVAVVSTLGAKHEPIVDLLLT